jgi:hypothetical protein
MIWQPVSNSASRRRLILATNELPVPAGPRQAGREGIGHSLRGKIDDHRFGSRGAQLGIRIENLQFDLIEIGFEQIDGEAPRMRHSAEGLGQHLRRGVGEQRHTQARGRGSRRTPSERDQSRHFRERQSRSSFSGAWTKRLPPKLISRPMTVLLSAPTFFLCRSSIGAQCPKQARCEAIGPQSAP